ncbi:MAG: hypothetical protein BGN87_08330 [Rhizobiales bacterium 65-79]|nr:hypothetical protein [Hyphomicrobiales bacterium]OJU04559.1 MAG: hypothetical protein BGN87_08330 [Rhizobiales bacterium 65-79]
MDVDKVIALVSAAGIELTGRRRNSKGDGWSLSFSSGAAVEVSDGGRIGVSGNGAADISRLLDLPAKPG